MSTDELEDPSDESRHTVGRNPQRQPSPGTKAPSYHKLVDIPSSGQGSFSASRAALGGLEYAPRESVDHSESPPAVPVEVVGRPVPAQPPGLQEICDRYERVLTD